MNLKNICDSIFPFFESEKDYSIDDIYNDLSQIKIHNLLNIPPGIRNGFKLVIYCNIPNKLTSISIHIFRKNFCTRTFKYLDNNINYLSSIFLEDFMECEYNYDWKFNEIINDNNENNDNINDENFINKIKLEINEDELDLNSENLFNHFREYMDDFDFSLNNTELEKEDLEKLFSIKSGLYFNKDDIRWQVYIRDLITAEIGCNGRIYQYINSSKFKNCNFVNAYLPNYNKNSIYEKVLYKSFSIRCDCCNNMITLCDDKILFWHNDQGGDLCNKCYKQKQIYELNRKKHLKQIILNEGRKILFKKDLQITKSFLNSISIKELDIYKKYIIMKQVNKQLSINNLLKNTYCPICLDIIDKTNFSTSKCGHCFHTTCISKCNDTCPVCREKTIYHQIFL